MSLKQAMNEFKFLLIFILLLLQFKSDNQHSINYALCAIDDGIFVNDAQDAQMCVALFKASCSVLYAFYKGGIEDVLSLRSMNMIIYEIC